MFKLSWHPTYILVSESHSKEYNKMSHLEGKTQKQTWRYEWIWDRVRNGT